MTACSPRTPPHPHPRRFANPFFNDRFVQYDRAANQLRWSAQGVDACGGGFRTLA